MTTPGLTYEISDAPAPSSVPRGVDRVFIAGMTERGPIVPTKVTSLSGAVSKFGASVAYGFLYDWLDVAFREGLAEAWISRVVGDAPVLATANLFDTAGSTPPADVSARIDAKSYGAWANALNVEVVAGVSSGFRVIVSDDVLGVLETTPDLASVAELIAWATTTAASPGSAYINVVAGAGSAQNPRVQGPTSLAGGTDDHAAAADANWTTAINRFVSEYGSGGIGMPGRTTTAAYTAVRAAAAATNRIALLDGADTPTVATLLAAAALQRGSSGDRFSALFGPWVIAPGIVPGTLRTVPPTALVAGLMARSDNAGNSPNTAAAGDNGIARYCLGVSQDAWSFADRGILNEGGVNVIREVNEVTKLYGYRTLANPLTQPAWKNLGGSREVAYIVSEVLRRAEAVAFDDIDGQGHKISEYHGIVVGVCSEEFGREALFGASQAEAFAVDTGAQVNTPETIAANRLLAAVRLKTSPMAEDVHLVLTHLLPTDSVG